MDGITVNRYTGRRSASILFRKTTEMNKKLIIALVIFLLAAIPASAQHYVGVRGGYGMSFGMFDVGNSFGTGIKMENVWNRLSGGLVWKYYSSENHYGGVEKRLAGISVELEYLQKGYEYYLKSGSEFTNKTYRRTFSSLHLPLMWQPHINMFGNRFRLFLNLGVWVSYNFPNSTVEYLEDGVVTATYPYKNILIRDNPFGYGVCGGIGFDISFDRWTVSLDARYYQGFGDILRSRVKYPNYPDPNDPSVEMRNPLHSMVSNVNVSLMLLYRLTDGAYNPRPSKRAQRREEERREAQLLDALRQREEAAEAMEAQEAQETVKTEETTETTEKNGNDQAAESSEADTERYQRNIQ